MSEFQKLLQKKKAERDRNIEKMDIGKNDKISKQNMNKIKFRNSSFP